MTNQRALRHAWLGLLLSGLVLPPGLAHAAPELEASPGTRIVSLGRVVSDAVLDATRGGFVTSDGLRVDFGIERQILLNGQEIYGLRLQYSNGGLKPLTGGSTAPPSASLDPLGLRLSAGEIASGNAHQTLPGFSLQNSIDGQAIRAITTIQVDVNSLSSLRNQQLFESLRQTIGGNFGR